MKTFTKLRLCSISLNWHEWMPNYLRLFFHKLQIDNIWVCPKMRRVIFYAREFMTKMIAFVKCNTQTFIKSRWTYFRFHATSCTLNTWSIRDSTYEIHSWILAWPTLNLQRNVLFGVCEWSNKFKVCKEVYK